MVLVGGAVVAQDKNATAAAIQGNPDNLPPNIPEWSKVLGDGVAANPYGKPSKFEKHVVPRCRVAHGRAKAR